ncbi:phosphate ABC transporter substrate-binding protein [Campylobacterota bacterium]|nr:phosphate ABC transporter substrate-binding protein [Campylobacterota bacterium]
MAVAFASLALFVFGYFWAKRVEKTVSFATNFLLFALPIYTLICANFAFLISDGYIFYSSFNYIALYFNPLMFVINFFYLFIGVPQYLFFVHLCLYAVFSAGFWIGLYRNGLKLELKYPKILALSAVVLLIGISAQMIDRNSRFLPASIERLESVAESLNDIYASNDDDITPPRGKPTLSFGNDLPKLDGATAFCYMFKSVYYAIYPAHEWYPYLQCSTTEYAYRSLIDNETDLVFAFEPSNELRELAREKGVELLLTPIGKEAFVFIVNAENPIKSLSAEQIRKIYSGAITNWREVGGADEKILAFQRNANSGSQTAMENMVMKEAKLMPAHREVFTLSMGGMIEVVADYRNAANALCYSFRYYATYMHKSENIRLLEIDSIAPNMENISNGSYPFTQEFYLVSRKDIAPNARKLID